MNPSKKMKEVLISLALALIIIGLAYLGLQATAESPGSTAQRIFTLLGGNILSGGYIQGMTYFAFFWGMIDIYAIKKNIAKENKGYRLKILPTHERHLLLAKDLVDIHLKASNLERQSTQYLLTSLIKKACIKFRTSNSVGQMIEIISIQTDINKEKAESEQSNIRYLTWVIPSIGFIGTVLGISSALTIANSGDMTLITSTLGVAFDTTLISLILSIIIMWFFHALQKDSDELHAGMKEYLIENLVNRIEV
ncbi:MAG: hypothetical protein HN509_00890 [Halobacteriovoraceae bacterium]|mgnify:CR=1 FL=1|jgi:biopolymer transport protein ExbB/TolQ|nr:hypothetical protein [Halobacteriovoraceae bacterium]MBT5092886.1 hypothetical protein [Halobacteriovoraceae bacterium]